MLQWALIFLVISVIAGALGFAGVSVAFGRVAKTLFVIFVAIFVVLLILGLVAGEAFF